MVTLVICVQLYFFILKKRVSAKMSDQTQVGHTGASAFGSLLEMLFVEISCFTVTLESRHRTGCKFVICPLTHGLPVF